MLNNFRRPNSKTELGFITPNCNIRVNIYCIDCRVFVLKPEFRKFIWPTLTYDLRPLALFLHLLHERKITFQHYHFTQRLSGTTVLKLESETKSIRPRPRPVWDQSCHKTVHGLRPQDCYLHAISVLFISFKVIWYVKNEKLKFNALSHRNCSIWLLHC